MPSELFRRRLGFSSARASRIDDDVESECLGGLEIDDSPGFSP
jgi:hypothetical protein